MLRLLLVGLVAPGVARAQSTWNVSGSDSLTEAVDNAVDGDTIEIEGSWTRQGDEPVTLVASLTLRGTSGVPILPPLLVAGDHDIVLEDVAFDASYELVAEQRAAYLQTGGSLTADDIVLSVVDGDGLVLLGTVVQIDGIVASGFRAGRAVQIANSPLAAVITDGWFEDDTAGALGFDHSVVLVEDSSFVDNAGTDVYAVGGELLVERCDFTGSDGVVGGAIAVFDGDLSVLTTDFEDVSADEAAVAVVADTLDLGPLSATFDDIVVDGATALATVGAIALSGDVDAVVTGSTFLDTRVLGSEATDTAGGIVVDGGTLDLNWSTFEGHRGWIGGAVTSVNGAVLDVTQVDFLGVPDEAGDAEAATGGAIAAFDSQVTVSFCTFDDLTASTGGGLSVAGGSLDLSYSTFDGVASKVQGGAVWVLGADVYAIETSFVDTTALDGGAWHQTLGSVELHGSRVVGAHAGGDGGAMVLRGLTGLKLANNLFCQVVADRSDVVRIAGGLGPSVRRITNNRFISNSADSGATVAWRLAVPVGGEPVLSQRTSTLEVVNNTWVSDGSPMGAVGLWWGDAAELTNALFDHGEVGLGVYDTSVAVSGGYNLWEGLGTDVIGDPTLPGDHAVYDSPGFQDDPHGCDATHYLAVWAPARDAGDPAILDVDGTRSDIGAWGGPWTGLQDLDGDGWLEDADCDDDDENVNPDVEEVWYDTVDQDCDGNDLDADYDGYDALDHGGDDCDDTDDRVHPGAADSPDDGVDQDCDGHEGKSWLTGSGGCVHGGGGVAGWWFAAFLVGWRRRNASR